VSDPIPDEPEPDTLAGEVWVDLPDDYQRPDSLDRWEPITLNVETVAHAPAGGAVSDPITLAGVPAEVLPLPDGYLLWVITLGVDGDYESTAQAMHAFTEALPAYYLGGGR
jgi:hypothetical protein